MSESGEGPRRKVAGASATRCGQANCPARKLCVTGCDPSDKTPQPFGTGRFSFEFFVLAATYSCLATTIGAEGLNCRVRNENGCTPFAKPPTQNTQKNFSVIDTEEQHNMKSKVCIDTRSFHYRVSHAIIPTIPNESSDRRISTPRLNALLRLHLVPINVVISHGSITISYLGVGFLLRCFQKLSMPDIATGRSSWR